MSSDKDPIILFISSYSGGKGGHYYSLFTIANELSKYYRVIIINVGNVEADVLKKWTGEIYFIKSTGFNFKLVLSSILELYNKYQPVLIHSFDVHSALFARKVSYKTNCPYVVTKCGGPPPDKAGMMWRNYYPTFKFQTVFNEDDYQYFNKKNKNKYLAQIKQRVSDPKKLYEDVSVTEIADFFKSDNYLNVVRIGRIGHKYFDTIVQSINLVRYLNENGVASKLAIIGYIESEDCLDNLRKIATEHVHFFTNNEHTRQASRFLKVADISIGTGRNFMESCAFGCVVFAPVKNSKYPALVTHENFRYFEKSNFSERVLINGNIDPERDVKKYIEKIKSEELRNEIGNKMEEVFYAEFDVVKAINGYRNIYKKCIKNNIYEDNIIDQLLHSIMTRVKIIK